MPESGAVDLEFQLAPPSAAALVESLRGVGYSTPTAVADIIDNSISSAARNVWLDFQWADGAPRVTILDDGTGMSATELVEAMRLGGRNPRDARALTDLGRFGLGLKTASFSQGRRLTVATRREDRVEAFRWDLDHIEQGGRDWHLLRGADPASRHFLLPLDALQSGTMVMWEKLDRLSGAESADELSESVFLETIDRVEEHLAMVFHRFLEGSNPDLRIFINGDGDAHRIKPWDPFLCDHPATIRRPVERIPTRAGLIEVQGFVLPHKDWLSAAENLRAGGHEGWTSQQGFYVYRNRRMLVAGSWLGLGTPRRWAKEEAHKLARLRLDISNTADEDWKIDIKKSDARPPPYIRHRLRTLGDDARQLARLVFVHRGTYGAGRSEPEVERVWMAVQKKGAVTYRIRREHPAVQQAMELAGAEEIESLMRIIEETVPVQRIWLDATERGEVPVRNFEGAAAQECERVLAVLYGSLRKRLGLSAELARSQLLRTEPFNVFPELIAALPDNPD